tara:strand:+ start:5714 stop:6325 length:612 start_codon:yes stop_codon:yes gene_type:complete
MFSCNPVYPPVTGWLEVGLSKEVVNYLWSRIDKAQGSAKGNLAGHISSSLDLVDENKYFENILLGCVQNYTQQFPYTPKKLNHMKIEGLKLNGFWVNYQKEHEFNPSHDHGGVFSFVVWMKIPTISKDQNNKDFLRDVNNSVASDFEMSYIDTSGVITSYIYKMNPDMEGNMLFFPSSFRHGVYPFYDCNEDRISISGNLYYT